jgi:hypothetical protein
VLLVSLELHEPTTGKTGNVQLKLLGNRSKAHRVSSEATFSYLQTYLGVTKKN